MKKHLIILMLFMVWATTANAGYKVTRVIDGDTIDIQYHGKTERIRMLSVDTPESVHPDKARNAPLGKVASKYTKKRLMGKEVELRFETRRRGKYGRLLAYVIVNGENYSLELVRKGLSPYYIKYGRSEKHDLAFSAAEKKAQDQKLYIWADSEFRKKGSNMSPRKTHAVDLSFVASSKSKVFHYPGCRASKRIKPSNRVTFQTYSDAANSRRRPCKICNPSKK